MTDQKWRSPTGHPIASHENDVQAAFSIINSGAVINVEQEWDGTRVLIIPIGKGVSKDDGWKLLDTIKRALAQKQPDAELLEALRSISNMPESGCNKLEIRIATEAVTRAEQKGGA